MDFTYINESGVVTVLEVMQDGGFVEAGELCHVLDLVKFRWVHLLDIVLSDEHPFTGLSDFHLDLVAALALDSCRHEPLRLVGHPYELLRGPFCLCCRVVETVPVHGEDTQFRVRTIYPGVVRHLCLARTQCLACWKNLPPHVFLRPSSNPCCK